ncbi:sulfatase-like hydrolase/transferase [Microvirga sp. 3-52]|uniref:sulfatase-like hydrolase/transferase n=1 Tax=Microvirga sp. 3-52 TaxID=2792425 RepID=UPI001AC282F1|nr:sulfatase-like hydrolase/transferase [Microvirga sp. 3-52]MBO1904702.1 sulfatase-like hydrolase/transferase [Microvirga sp. 3-52]MBS7455192.1 sulfatase-like hydrolase/transferase [Microvirga sp. 3-52]
MAPAGLTKILYRVLVGGVLMWLLAVAISTAAREYSGAGALLVFGILVYLFGAVLSSNRYTLCTGLVLSAVLICLDQADRLKFSYVQSHLNLYDLILVGNMVAHWDTTVAWQYMGEVWPFLLWFGIAVGTAPLALRLERTIGGDGAWARSARHRAFCSCVVLLGTQLIILGNSQYLRTTSTFHAFLTATEPGGLRVANVLNFGLRMAQTWSNLRKDAETLGRSSLLHTAAGPSPQMCVSCPDLVFVHLESTFDPNLLEEYSRAPGYLSRMAAEGEQRSLGGSLLVNTYGGGSWISEFELLCGINHALFGDAGLYPHLFVSPFLKGCIPAYLKSQGYRTFAIYTTDPFFAGAGTGFRNYGVDTFLDNQAVGAPVHWREQRDIYFIDALRRLLSEPSDTPRFIFVSTKALLIWA